MDGGLFLKDKVLANKIKIMRNHGLPESVVDTLVKIAGFRRSIPML